MNIRQILFTVFAVGMLVGCGGSQQGSGQSRVRMVTSEGAEQSQQSGEVTVEAAFPSECAGLQKVKEEPACYGIRDRQFCSQTAVLCSCEGNGTQVRWAMLKSPENLGQNGYCTGRPPVVRQVERVTLASSQTAALPPPVTPAIALGLPPSATATTPPPAPVGTAILAPPSVEARELAQQTTCTNDLAGNALRCKVNRRQVAGGVTIATADEFACVGHNFTPLSAQQLAGYNGFGAPCTCTKGQMKQMSGVKNTWWCDAGDAG